MRLAVCAACLLACSRAPEVATARLTLAELPSCELRAQGAIDGPMQLRASGDFPMQAQELGGEPPYAIDAFPPDTRWLAVEVRAGERRAGSLVALSGEDQTARALLLPFGQSCPLGDPLFAARAGTALAAVPGGGLLIAGGRDAQGAATASATLLAAGATLATEVAGGMLLRRAGASATRIADGVLIAGGAPDERGPAHDTFEVYDAASQAFATAQSAKLAAGPRRDHGAALLPDGRVLLAGGVAELESAPLASAELIDHVTGRASLLAAGLHVPRAVPHLLALDSGSVLVALGRDEQGVPVAAVERFDPEMQRFERLAAELPVHAHAAVAALEGDRVAYVGCDGPDGPDAGCELVLLLPEAGDFAVVSAGLDALGLAEAGLHGLTQLRALALRDGRLFVSGRDESSAIERRAFLIDLNLPAIAAAEISRVAEHLIALDDGSIAELEASGGSLHREELRSELDDASPRLLDPDSLGVALDLRERWQAGADALVAREQARLDLPHLRFAAVRIELELAGQALLLLEPEGAPALEVRVDDDRVERGGCSISRDAAGSIAIERRGDEVVFESGARTRRCRVEALSGRVGVALRVTAGTRVLGLRVTRL